jgi:transposase
VDALSSFGVTPLSSLMAAEAATRVGVLAQDAPRDTTSFHLDGRSKSAEEPDATVMPITQGYRRDHRPDLHQERPEPIVTPHAGMPVLMTPRRGKSTDSGSVAVS